MKLEHFIIIITDGRSWLRLFYLLIFFWILWSTNFYSRFHNKSFCLYAKWNDLHLKYIYIFSSETFKKKYRRTQRNHEDERANWRKGENKSKWKRGTYTLRGTFIFIYELKWRRKKTLSRLKFFFVFFWWREYYLLRLFFPMRMIR